LEENILGDPNELLTTLVSLNGGLVAIIGGFLVSRLIAMSSEKNGIKGKITESQQEINRINGKISEQDDELLKLDKSWFAKHAYGKVFDDSVPLEDLLKDEFINLNNRTEEELKSTYEALIKRKEKQLEMVSRYSPSSRPPELAPELVAQLQESFKQMFPQASEEEKEAHRKKKEQEENHKRAVAKKEFKEQQAVYIEEKEKLQKEVNYWKEKIEDNKLLLSHIGKPRGIIGGIVFIVFAIILGILLPLFYIPMEDGAMTKDLKLTLLGSTIAVLLFFIGYLITLAVESEQ
jgi:hypothetical protein